MRRIELELATARPRWPAWAMAAVGLLLAADAATTWLGLRAQWHDTLRRQGALPRNAGKPWTHEEDDRLLQAFDGGATVDALTAAHERTRAGIEARLVKHGRLEAENAPAARIR